MATLAILAGTALAAVGTAAINQTNFVEKEYYENLGKPEQLNPKMVQNFPYDNPGVIMRSPSTRVYKYNIYGQTSTRTYIGEGGVSAITGFGAV